MTDGYNSAFPCNQDGSIWGGLTKREYFAAMAMQGILASNAFLPENSSPSNIARYSIGYADALIIELNEQP